MYQDEVTGKDTQPHKAQERRRHTSPENSHTGRKISTRKSTTHMIQICGNVAYALSREEREDVCVYLLYHRETEIAAPYIRDADLLRGRERANTHFAAAVETTQLNSLRSVTG